MSPSLPNQLLNPIKPNQFSSTHLQKLAKQGDSEAIGGALVVKGNEGRAACHLIARGSVGPLVRDTTGPDSLRRDSYGAVEERRSRRPSTPNAIKKSRTVSVAPSSISCRSMSPRTEASGTHSTREASVQSAGRPWWVA
jgi:hypothetical protein